MWDVDTIAPFPNGRCGSSMGLGYISSANMYEPNTPDFIQGTDYNAIIAWMDNYCRAHPLDRIDIAALALVGELLAKKR